LGTEETRKSYVEEHVGIGNRFSSEGAGVTKAIIDGKLLLIYQYLSR
jgi:hypothetical protein